MGLLIKGTWHDQWYDTKETEGRFERDKSRFRNWITPDGSPGPSGEGGFKAEPGRYHLYVSLACPWAHRTLIFRKIKGLESMIGLSVVNPLMKENGWTFHPGHQVKPDPIHNAEFMHQVYTAAQSDYTGRVTVPALWDREKATIVSNESADIIRMFNSAFDSVGAREGDFYPEDLRAGIDEINATVYSNVNNGVYKSGFATTQEAYEEAVIPLFETLKMLEARLGEQRYLLGGRLTEADWRLFTTLVRFDPVYVSHFKCNLHRIADFPNLSGFMRELFQYPGVAETVDIRSFKEHYFASHDMINPTGVIPVGPAVDLHAAPNRDHLPVD